MQSTINRCRICGNTNLVSLLHLGDQVLTGVFPSKPDARLTRGPLELVRCAPAGGTAHCGLVQLRHSYDPADLYGDNYGYRSSLNRSMVEHLRCKVAKLVALARRHRHLTIEQDLLLAACVVLLRPPGDTCNHRGDSAKNHAADQSGNGSFRDHQKKTLNL